MFVCEGRDTAMLTAVTFDLPGMGSVCLMTDDFLTTSQQLYQHVE